MISIHALREEGDLTKRLKRTDTGISIHALREEGDGELRFALPSYWYFYPRPPRGGRHPRRSDTPKVTLFLSTPSARRATPASHPTGSAWPEFLSTPSARRATYRKHKEVQHGTISIHALREEGDLESAAGSAGQEDFYPRPPRGGRPGISCWISRTGRFLSTPSARRATGLDGLACGDGNADFYPRPPRGGRQTHGNKAPPEYRFLSTPSARRATSCGAYHQSVRHYFYPRPPRGGRPDGAGHGRRTCCISIHALREEGDQG